MKRPLNIRKTPQGPEAQETEIPFSWSRGKNPGLPTWLESASWHEPAHLWLGLPSHPAYCLKFLGAPLWPPTLPSFSSLISGCYFCTHVTLLHWAQAVRVPAPRVGSLWEASSREASDEPHHHRRKGQAPYRMPHLLRPTVLLFLGLSPGEVFPRHPFKKAISPSLSVDT